MYISFFKILLRLIPSSDWTLWNVLPWEQVSKVSSYPAIQMAFHFPPHTLFRLIKWYSVPLDTRYVSTPRYREVPYTVMCILQRQRPKHSACSRILSFHTSVFGFLQYCQCRSPPSDLSTVYEEASFISLFRYEWMEFLKLAAPSAVVFNSSSFGLGHHISLETFLHSFGWFHHT